MPAYRDEGVVLRSIRLGEADRIVTFATPEHGKVRAVAKGVRRTTSRIGGRVEPLTHVRMMCWRGRELDVVTQVEVLEPFRGIRADLERTATAITMLEVVDQVAVERQPMPEVFRLLTGALHALEASPAPLLLAGFYWKLVAAEGVAPDVGTCSSCGAVSPPASFDPATGGFCCRSCRRGEPVSARAAEIVGAILAGRLRSVLGEPASSVTAEVERLGQLAVEHHIDRRLRSPRHPFEGHGPPR